MTVLAIGEYLFDVNRQMLTKVPENYEIDLWKEGSIKFYIDLDIDFSRDQIVPLYLDRDGCFTRTDHIVGKASIDCLF